MTDTIMPKLHGLCVACIGLMLLSTSGCEAVNAANEYLAERARKADEARIGAARASCVSYGFASGTDAFAACIQAEVNQQKLREEVAEAARRSELSKSYVPATPSSTTSTTTTCRRTILGTVECTAR